MQLTIPNRLAEIPRMSAWLESALLGLGLPDRLRFKFDLCANEAVTNIISYGYADDAIHEIRLRLQAGAEAVTLEIEDDGAAFNPLTRPVHVPVSSLEDALIGGLGIDLMRSFMDECSYARRDGRNILSMTAFRPPPGQANRSAAAAD